MDTSKKTRKNVRFRCTQDEKLEQITRTNQNGFNKVSVPSQHFNAGSGLLLKPLEQEK